mmetsp:Transcript_7556/g.11965  ORF Transcript_7556/g.11965 Transcript_7556/m.11965 type:complete len:472 (+) Transcript_7556:24-1439(+)
MRIRSLHGAALLVLAALLLSTLVAVHSQEDPPSEGSPSSEDIEALKAQLAAAEQRAKDAESQLQKMKEREAEKEQEITKKDQELQKALDSQQAASKAIKDASSEKESLAQAKQEMESKIKSLEAEKAAAAADSEKVSKLEGELHTLKQKLSKEQDARDLVLKLRKEKEELKMQLEEERKNIYYQAKEVWIPQATESLKNFTSSATDTAAKLAEQMQDSVAKAEQEVARQLNELEKHEHVESIRSTAKPILQDAKKSASSLLGQGLQSAKYPITALRQHVRNMAGEMGALAKYKEEYAKGSDYWLVFMPLILCYVVAAQLWLKKGFRCFCLRVQQVLFFIWGSVAFCAMILKEDTAALISDSLDPPALVAFHSLVCLQYAVTGVLYLTLFLSGPSRITAVMQSAAVAWVLYSYYTVLLDPMLMHSKAGSLPVPQSFASGHLLRAFFSVSPFSSPLSLKQTHVLDSWCSSSWY